MWTDSGIGIALTFLVMVGALLIGLLPVFIAAGKGHSSLVFLLFSLVAWPIALAVALLIGDKDAERSNSPPDGELAATPPAPPGPPPPAPSPSS